MSTTSLEPEVKVAHLVRANTPAAARVDTAERRTLAPRVLEAAAARLNWITLICAVLTALTLYLDSWLQPDMAATLDTPVLRLTGTCVVLVSLVINAVQRFRLLPPLGILNLALVFEVTISAAISFAETAHPMSPQVPVLGASKLTVWIVLMGLLIPNKPWIKFATALASASTWPMAYALNIYIHGYTPLPANRLIMWIYLPCAMAFVNFAISTRTYRMETAVQRARDLGSYQLISRIGSGGMGEVWRARHRMLARDAAIKLIRADLMLLQPGRESDLTRRRFTLEAQAIASLQSPHTVYVYDFGISEEGSFYYVMELLDGISLQKLVEKFGPQPAARVVHMLRQICESLEEAHRLGLIHRDIKPNNILACSVGVEYDFMKVLDFGLVKNISRTDTMHLTATGVTAGTPAYMAPEMALGADNLDGRVDIYGLGCVAYFLLAGAPVFDEKTATATLMAHVQKVPAPLSERTEMQIPPGLESVVMRCLAKNPADRPQSALELSRLLGAIGDIPGWTQEDAARWWQSHLPARSGYGATPRNTPLPATDDVSSLDDTVAQSRSSYRGASIV